MRFPIWLEDELNDYARMREFGSEINQAEIEEAEPEPTFTLTQLEAAMNQVALETRPRDRADVLKLFKKLKQQLGS